MPNKPITYNGVLYKSRKELMESLGICRSTFYKYIAKGLPIEKKQVSMAEYNGELLTVSEIAKRAGLAECTVRCRVKQGIPLEREKNYYYKKVTIDGKEYKTIEDACKFSGHCRRHINNRMAEYSKKLTSEMLSSKVKQKIHFLDKKFESKEELCRFLGTGTPPRINCRNFWLERNGKRYLVRKDASTTFENIFRLIDNLDEKTWLKIDSAEIKESIAYFKRKSSITATSYRHPVFRNYIHCSFLHRYSSFAFTTPLSGSDLATLTEILLDYEEEIKKWSGDYLDKKLFALRFRTTHRFFLTRIMSPIRYGNRQSFEGYPKELVQKKIEEVLGNSFKTFKKEYNRCCKRIVFDSPVYKVIAEGKSWNELKKL